MHKLSRKNGVELGAITIIFLIAAMFVYKTTILPRMILPRMVTVIKEETGNLYLVSENDVIKQTFRNTSDELLSVGIQVSLDEDTLKHLVANEEDRDLGTLHLEVLEEESGQLMMQADYDVYALSDGQNLLASFPEAQTGWDQKKLTIQIDAKGIRKEVELGIGYTTDVPKDCALSVNGTPQSYACNLQIATHQFFYWKKWFFFGAGLVYLLLTGTYVGLAVFRLRAERVFLFTGALLAILYLLLMPPMTVPDEYAHYKETYYHANRVMGKQSAGDMIEMELEDYHATQMFSYTPSLTEYDVIKENIKKKGREEGTTKLVSRYTQASALLYLPGIIGITLGRLLGLNGLLVICLGRICAICFYLISMYWFIRWMPFAKSLSFILAILPMTIQQCCSYSYDGVIIEGVFLYLALLFRLLYREETIKKWQIVCYGALVILLSLCKGGAYMPLCLLTLFIPASRFLGKKRKAIFVGSMAALSAATFLSKTLSYVLYVAAPTAEQAESTYLGADAYGLSGLLSDPMNFLCVSVRTLFLSGDGFLETMIGMQLGWLNIFVSRIVIYGLLLLMLLSLLPIKDGKKRRQITVTPMQKAAYFLTGGMSVGMSFASLFMSWTPTNAKEIAGIQGRYFLPLLPALLLLCFCKAVVIKRDMGRQFMFLAVSLQCVAIYGILLSLEGVL